MGAPMPDLWLRRNLKWSGATVGIGVGGRFDLHGGRVPRAQLGLRDIGGEWSSRPSPDPYRMWHHDLVGNATFLWRVARERMARGAANGG